MRVASVISYLQSRVDDSDDSDGERYLDFAEAKSPGKQRNVRLRRVVYVNVL